jgi:hypothetical protein
MSTSPATRTSPPAVPKRRSASKTPAAAPAAKTASKPKAAAPAKKPNAAARKTAAATKSPAATPQSAKSKPKGSNRSAGKGPAKPRAKLVRDSFTMPQADFALIDLLKQRALEFKRPTKKSELLRAGLQALADLSSQALESRLGALVELKTGRPRKGG